MLLKGIQPTTNLEDLAQVAGFTHSS